MFQKIQPRGSRLWKNGCLSGAQWIPVWCCDRTCNKTNHYISSLLNIPKSTVREIRTKWKWLGMSAPFCSQLQTSKLHLVKVYLLDPRKDICPLHLNHCFRTSSCIQATHHQQLCNMRDPVVPLDSRAVETFSLERSVTLFNWPIWWMSLGLVVSRRTVLVWLHCARCKVWRKEDYSVGSLFRSWAWGAP